MNSQSGSSLCAVFLTSSRTPAFASSYSSVIFSPMKLTFTEVIPSILATALSSAAAQLAQAFYGSPSLCIHPITACGVTAYDIRLCTLYLNILLRRIFTAPADFFDFNSFTRQHALSPFQKFSRRDRRQANKTPLCRSFSL